PRGWAGWSPFAHVLMMGGVSVAAFILLHYIRADLSGRPRGAGMIARAADVALGMGMHAAIGAGGTAALKGAKGLAARWRSRSQGQAPWEQVDAAAGDARRVHGEPQPGYTPVPDATDPGGGGAGGGPAETAAGGGAAPGRDGAGASVGGGGGGGASGRS